MDELDALRGMRTALAEEEHPDRIALRTNWRAASVQPRSARRVRRPRLPLIGLAAAGTAAVVAAGAVAVSLSSADHEPRRGTASPKTTGGTIAQGNVLLVAATSAQKAPGAGKYWHYRRTLGDIYAIGTSAANHYKVAAKQTFESWTDRNGVNRSFMADPPATPVTPQDRAKWVAAGSPVELTGVPSADGPVVIFMKPLGRGPVPPALPKDGYYGLSMEQIAALPTDPGELEKVLLNLRGRWEAVSDSPAKKPIRALRGEKRVRALSEVAGDLLSSVPAPPQVRAAVFRMLAAQPGVRAEGQGTDPMGRTGAVISLPLETTVPLGLFTAPKQLGTYRRQWIISPETGNLLAIRDLVVKPPHGSRPLPPGDDGKPRRLRARDMPDRFHRPGEVASYALFEVTEWTDAPPR